MTNDSLSPNGKFLHQRVRELYDDAKAKAGGNSLSIYGEVSDVLDALERGDDDAEERADNLCGTLRLRYHAEAPWEKNPSRRCALCGVTRASHEDQRARPLEPVGHAFEEEVP